MGGIRRWIIAAALIGLLLAGCGGPEGEPLTAADFGVAEETEGAAADDHDDEHDHGAAEEPLGEEATLLDHHGQPIPEEIYEKVEAGGVAVEFTMEGFLGLGGRGTILSTEVKAGEYATVKFKISDSESGQPLSGLFPAAWIDPHAETAEHASEEACKENIEIYLQGFLNARAQIDLNSFFILGMNEDATISVIDPLANVGGMTQLYAMMLLKQPGEDWVMSADQRQVFVTMPTAGEVAVIDTTSFQVDFDIPAGENPTQVAAQPDGRYVWVGNDSDRRSESGVTVIDPALSQAVAFIETGRGQHQLAFSPDSRLAYVTNGGDGSLSIIDTNSLSVVGEVDSGREPASLDVSALTGEVWVSDRRDGRIVVIDGSRAEVVGEIDVARGLEQLRFAPGGHWALAVNPEEGLIWVLDAASRAVTHETSILGQPDQITFSNNLAYIRPREAAAVVTIPQKEVAADQALPLTNVPIGRQAPGEFGQPAQAAAIAPAPDGAGVLIANPADAEIYYYVEGATGTLGSFIGHGRSPRAVLAVDRSLKEEAPGVYVGQLRLPAEGEYEVSFLLTNPVVSNCFYFTVKPGEQQPGASDSVMPDLTMTSDLSGYTAGEPITLQVQLKDGESEAPIEDVSDLILLVSPLSSIWQKRFVATPLGDGQYAVTFTLDEPGRYNVFFTVRSLGATADVLPRLLFEVE